jgi:hypothetical protein
MNNNDDPVRFPIMELMMALYKHDIREVHIGALMRLVGVLEDQAHEYDGEFIELTDDFTEYINQMILLSSVSNIRQTLH